MTEYYQYRFVIKNDWNYHSSLARFIQDRQGDLDKLEKLQRLVSLERVKCEVLFGIVVFYTNDEVIADELGFDDIDDYHNAFDFDYDEQIIYE